MLVLLCRGSSSLVLGGSNGSSSSAFAISGGTTARGSASAGATTAQHQLQQPQAPAPSSLSSIQQRGGSSSGPSGSGTNHHPYQRQPPYNAQLAPNNTATGGGGSPSSQQQQSNNQASASSASSSCLQQTSSSSSAASMASPQASKRRWVPPSTLRYRPPAAAPSPLSAAGGGLHHHHQQQQQQRNAFAYAKPPPPPVVPPPVAPPSAGGPSSDAGTGAGAASAPPMGAIEAARQDQVFRKVRGILNKLTPEKFQKLSDDLLRMELSSYPILRGVIILIFNKALEEPKYSSMYAQLCKRLNEEVPHFVKDNKQCSFNLLLLNKCGDEFSKRRENLEHLNLSADHHPDSLLDEEERRHLAKRKMLGNIKFMGELGKLEILSGHLLHKCIQELLYTSNSLVKMGEDPAEDLECLCQIMRTSGRLLDSEESQPLVNQYFRRLNQLAVKQTLPPRIRFMLKDIIDLRSNQWMPRKATLVEGPMPIQQIRSPDDDHMLMGGGNRNNNNHSNNNSNMGLMNSHHHHQHQQHHHHQMNSMGGGQQSSSSSGGMRDHHHGGGGGGGMMGGYGSRDGYNRGGRDHHRGGDGHRGGDMGGDHRAGSDAHRGDLLFRHPMKTRGGIIEEMFKGMSLNPNAPNNSSSSNNGYNSGGNRSNVDTATDRDRNNSTFNNNARGGGGRRDGNYGGGGGSSGGGGGSGGGGLNQNRGQYKHNTGTSGGNQPYNNQTNKELAPRFKKNLIVRDLNLGEVELRPSINPGSFNKSITTVKMNNQVNAALPPSTRPLHEPSVVNSLNNASPLAAVTKTTVGTATLGSITTGSSIVSPLLMHNKDQLPIKSVPTDKQSKKNQKDKGVNKEDIFKRFGQLAHRFTQEEMKLEEAIEEIKELKVPEKFNKDLLKTTFQTEMNPKFVKLIGALRRDGLITGNYMQEVLKSACAQLNDDAENEMSKMAQVLSAAVQEQLLSLAEISGNITENGAHYPLFWLILQDLNQTIGKSDLDRLFKESKVNLTTQLGTTTTTTATTQQQQVVPTVADTSPSSATASGRELGQVLEARGLAHLCPLLRVQAQLAKQLQADPSAHHLYRWINENVDAPSHTETGFINALVSVLLQYISQEAALGNTSSLASTNPSSTSPVPPSTSPETITDAPSAVTADLQLPQRNGSGPAAAAAAANVADRDKAIADREHTLLEKYQGVLQKFLHEQPSLQLTALYAVQVYFHQLGFPRGQLLRWFNALYDLNIIDEDAFFSWKENVTDIYPGKGNALFQVNSWLTWLEESDYEEEEGEE